MQDEIDKWLEEYGEDAAFAGPARFIRQLREESRAWQKQAGFNLKFAADRLRELADQLSPIPD